MGITGRVAMPLLSTLAALVIIVHSAEEDMERERDYRYNLRPKVLDTRPSNYEQPWRLAEPMMQQSEPSESWNNHQNDEIPVRRRTGRKRKRRPPVELPDDTIQESKYSNVQEALPINRDYESDIPETTEMPRRRRKKLNLRPNRWIDEPTGSDQLIRSRLQRRKRPSIDSWPVLSEFGGLRQEYEENIRDRNKNEHINEDRRVGDLLYKTYNSEKFRDKGRNLHIPRPKQMLTIVDDNNDKNYEPRTDAKELAKEDKSLSEFSLEIMRPMDSRTDGNAEIFDDNKAREKSPKVYYELDKAEEKAFRLEFDKYFDFKSEYLVPNVDRKTKKKPYHTLKDVIQEIKSYDKYNDSVELRKVLKTDTKHIICENSEKSKNKLGLENGRQFFFEEAKQFKMDEEPDRDRRPIDPQTLKDILKRSNGTSLSEILQQHNLTLADLLSEKENAISVLKSETLLQPLNTSLSSEENKDVNKNKDDNNIEKPSTIKVEAKDNYESNSGTQSLDSNRSNSRKATTKEIVSDENERNTTNDQNHTNRNPNNLARNSNNSEFLSVPDNHDTSLTADVENSTDGMMVKRRFPGGIRRKLRMRPTINNNTYKSQLNRDLIAISTRKYVQHNRRNSTKGKTKAKEWRNMISQMPSVNVTRDNKELREEYEITTISVPTEETTLIEENETISPVLEDNNVLNDVQNETVASSNTEILESNSIPIEIVDTSPVPIEIVETEIYLSITEQPLIIPSVPAAVKQSSMRRQPSNNRLKRKRLKQKTSTTEAPSDDEMKNLLNTGDFVSSSEFIARTQIPKHTKIDDFKETATELEDFLTTEAIKETNSEYKTARPKVHITQSKPPVVTKPTIPVSTETTEKIEIQEILNDTRISAKLSNILRERNMTLSELLDHRERGSSYVHLADIFHNASREPNPPEPFLSKSLLEPISKETYPLRALIDANSHDSTTKGSATDPNHANIPVIMDFGNNVNENAENMGIISLFTNRNNRTKGTEHSEKILFQQDSDGTPYHSTVVSVNTSDENNARESRVFDDQDDLVNWHEIFSVIRKHHKNNTAPYEKLIDETRKKLEEDIDGDGLIVLEDIQHLKDIDSHVASKSEENVEFHSFEQDLHESILHDKPSSSTKSVTVATASIVGLAMVLFLLTYAALKWKQQRVLIQKNGYGHREERIPSPVFENRKVKKNCSSRSISPMLASSNIYTMSTLDSQNGKESPEYMWDTLRKPFQ